MRDLDFRPTTQQRCGTTARGACIVWLLAAACKVFAAEVDVVVGDQNGVPLVDAVVALIPVGDAAAARADRPATSIDQVNKQFRPNVLAVQTGTWINFPNSDNIRHQVYSFSEAKRFQTTLYSGKTAPPVLFDKSGVVVLGCNIHDSMSAYVYVLDTPFFGKTDGAGSVRIDAPQAKYSLTIYHPRYQNGRTPLVLAYEISAPRQSLAQVLALGDRAENASTTSSAHGTP